MSETKRPFFEPGWYLDLSNDQYHGSFGYSSSTIKKLAEKTSSHLPHLGMADSASLRLGTAVHALVLEPEKFESDFMVVPKIDRRTKAGKALYQQYMDKLGDKSELSEDHEQTAKRMADSVKSHRIASILLDDVVTESSVYWWYKSTDEDGIDYRLMAKVRPDAISKPHSVIIDLKTTEDATYSGFIRSMQKYYYHVSAAMYLDGVNQCRELLADMKHLAYTKFVFIVVENREPHLTAIYELSKEYLDVGKEIYRRCMKKIQQAENEGACGFPDEIRVLEPPNYANNLFIV